MYEVKVVHGQGIYNHYSRGRFETLEAAVTEAESQPEEHDGWYVSVYIEDEEGNTVWQRV